MSDSQFLKPVCRGLFGGSMSELSCVGVSTTNGRTSTASNNKPGVTPPGSGESEFPKYGLMRRAFSSKKRRRNKNNATERGPSGQVHESNASWLMVPQNNFTRNEQANARGDFIIQLDSPLLGDNTNKRSVFSRKCFGSVEMLAKQPMEGFVNNAGRFRVENGIGERERDAFHAHEQQQRTEFETLTSFGGASAALSPMSANVTGSVTGKTPVHLENPEKETRWYFKYFLGKMHQIYVGVTSEKDPFAIAVVITDFNNHNINHYRAILWRKSGSQKMCLAYNHASPLTIKKILSYFNVTKFEKGPREILHHEVQKDMLVLEEQEGSVNFKFGVLYCRNGQNSDELMYNNEYGSESFEAFIDLLGDKVVLKNWEHFKGGLDTKTNTTGVESVYTIYEGHEIMFHVSTLLPYSSDNTQQIERKRHVGNDIVNIIFVDECEDDDSYSWRPSSMKTHFTHIFAVVAYNKTKQCYRLHVYAEESVPIFGPVLPSPPEFYDQNEFRDFLLVKLINGEKAAFHSPVFAQKRQRTLEMLINNIIESNSSDSTGVLNRRAFSDIILDQNNTISTSKEQVRNDAFIRFGQMLKVNIIIRGDAPTSSITSGTLKKEPWKPIAFLVDCHLEINCGDSWGEALLVNTEQGTFYMESKRPPCLVIDKTCILRQLEVIDSVNVVILRLDKGRDSRICVLGLTELPTGNREDSLPLDKSSVKRGCIDKTKGCHLFAVSKSYGTGLRLVVAVHRRLQVYQWKYTTTCSSLSSWNQFTGSQQANGTFHFITELQTFEPAQLISIVDSIQHGCRICIAYKNQFDLIDEKTGDTKHLYRVENTRAHAVAILDVYADDEAELLLCHNRHCHFQKIARDSSPRASQSSDFDFSWNFEPKDVLISYPYVLAFTENAIEIRLIVNGSLVHTMPAPNCCLITSKEDIYFSSTADNLSLQQYYLERSDSSSESKGHRQQAMTPPSTLEAGYDSTSEHAHSQTNTFGTGSRSTDSPSSPNSEDKRFSLNCSNHPHSKLPSPLSPLNAGTISSGNGNPESHATSPMSSKCSAPNLHHYYIYRISQAALSGSVATSTAPAASSSNIRQQSAPHLNNKKQTMSITQQSIQMTPNETLSESLVE